MGQVIGICIVALCASGCAARTASHAARVDRPSVIQFMQQAYQRSEKEFARAAFWKPIDSNATEQITHLAPLIVQELLENQEHDTPGLRFGALVTLHSGETAIDSFRPTVYFAQRTIAFHGTDRTQIDYVWFYSRSTDAAHLERATRVSTILSDDGVPSVWIADEWESDAISSDAQHPSHRTYYVADSLEAEATDAFGSALPDRRFAVERAIEESQDVIVARIIEDGPQPLGPYVYLSHQPHRVTTLLCRCSPSQIQQITETGYYELRPLEDSDHVLQSLNVGATRHRKPKHDYTAVEDALRWPDQ